MRRRPDLESRPHKSFAKEEARRWYLLQSGDFQTSGTWRSCRQSSAGDGAVSSGMIARFREDLETAPYRYRQLFWATGGIGQVLSLEAEAKGVRATGIGCF